MKTNSYKCSVCERTEDFTVNEWKRMGRRCCVNCGSSRFYYVGEAVVASTDKGIVTEALLDKGMSRNGSWSNQQLKTLGVRFPLQKGWRRRLVGSSISPVAEKRFLILKDAHLKNK